MKALIVDDSRVLRMYLRMMMQAMGWQTEEAENGRQALEMLHASDDFSLTLLDVNMPEMNGIECVKRLRCELAAQDLKVMMVTTEEDFHLISDVLAGGADEFLMKPFTPENLRAKLQLLSLPTAARG